MKFKFETNDTETNYDKILRKVNAILKNEDLALQSDQLNKNKLMSMTEIEYLQEAYKLEQRPSQTLDQIFKNLKFFKRFNKEVRKRVIENSELIRFDQHHVVFK